MKTIKYDLDNGIYGTKVLTDIENISKEIIKLDKRLALNRWKRGKVKIKSN